MTVRFHDMLRRDCDFRLTGPASSDLHAPHEVARCSGACMHGGGREEDWCDESGRAECG